MKEALPGILWSVVVFVAAPTSAAISWEAWQQYSYAACTKNKECKERREEARTHVVDDEMPDAANQNYYRD